MISLVVVLLAGPLLEGRVPKVWLNLIFSGMLVSAVYTVGQWRQHLVGASLLGVPAVLGGLLFSGTSSLGSVTSNLLQLMFLCYTVFALLQSLGRPGPVDAERLSTAAAVYLLLGTVWVNAYRLVEIVEPGSFAVPTGGAPTVADLRYLSFVTLTTLGYGDVTPASGFARVLAILEAVTGTFFIAFLVSRLVSLYRRDSVDD